MSEPIPAAPIPPTRPAGSRSAGAVVRRIATAALAGAAALAALPVAAQTAAQTAAAQAYPSRPITMVVGFPPGGSNDIVARIIAPALAQALGGNVVVENRPGANALVGTEYVARANPDGHVITLASASPLVISPHTYPKMPFDTLKDLTGITTVAATSELLALHPSVPVTTLAELTALAQKQDVTIASSGNGGLPHLAIELLKNATKGRIVHVPYKGAGPALTDAIGGHVNGILVDLAPLYPAVKEGRLRAIANTDDKRSSALPDTPSSAEQGMPSLIALNWFAVMGPAGMPRPIVDKLHAALTEAVKSPDVVEKLQKVGIEPMPQPSPDAFADFLRSELVRWGGIAKASGARADQ